MAKWTWQVAVMVAAVLLCGAARPAAAADGSQVLDCIKKVQRASWSGGSGGEVIGAVACMGISGEAGGDEAAFEHKVKIISECYDKVLSNSRSKHFSSEARDWNAGINAATACVGAVDADETVKCMDKVSFKLRHATGGDAELIAAQACARGNPAEETAQCVGDVAFKLSASGVLSEYLAALACGR